MSTQQALAVIRLVIVLAGILVIVRNRCAPGNWMYSVPYIAWLAHAGVYLVAYLTDSLIGRVIPITYNVWGAGLQIQGYLTVLMVEVARWQRQHRKGGSIGC